MPAVATDLTVIAGKTAYWGIPVRATAFGETIVAEIDSWEMTAAATSFAAITAAAMYQTDRHATSARTAITGSGNTHDKHEYSLIKNSGYTNKY
jgi:hypothetical protein